MEESAMPREAKFPESGPRPGGPYSPAVIASGRLLYVSSQGSIDPGTGEPVRGSFEDQARQTLGNVQAIVDGCGGSLAQAVKVTVFLADLSNFAVFNEIYATFFPEPRPARTTIQSDVAECIVDVIVSLDE
jgi:2-iminobutanoate/2-iminopropanoate deaminase